MANLELIRNLATLIIADAREVLPANTDEAEAQEEALKCCINKAEKILEALDAETKQ